VSALKRKYATATTIYFPLSERNKKEFLSASPTFQAADTKISLDGGSPANTTNTPTAVSGTWQGSKVPLYSLALTSGEMTAAQICILVIEDSGTAWADQMILIETYGNAIAEHAFDLDTAVQDVNVQSMDANTVTSTSIENSAITDAKIATGAITTAKFGGGAIDSTVLAADSIGASQIAANAIGSAELATGAITSDQIAAGALSNAAFAAAALADGNFAADMDTYQAKVWLFDDDDGTADRYVAVWHKNGEPVTSGITSPTIQVIKVADGTDLVTSTGMTQIASLGMYRHDEATNRIVDGAAYVVKVEASIDSATRTWYQPVGRDT